MKSKSLCYYGPLFLVTLLGCRSIKPAENFNREFVTIKLLDGQHFRYFYYNSTFTDITHYYCRGHYTMLPGKRYELYPDSIDPTNFEVQSRQRRKANIKNGTELKVETDITDGPLDLSKYKITVFSDSLRLIVNGIKMDTLLQNIKLRAFRVKVDLRNDYTKMSPTPTFNSITSSNITLAKSSNSITIRIPVSVELFYYKYKKYIQIEDDGKYWIVDDKKILKNNNFPIQ